MEEKNNRFGGGGRFEPRGRDRDRDRGMDRDGGDMDGMGMDGPSGGPYDLDKDRRMFSRKKSCWFCAKKEDPDWKETSSYDWLINEFGKISPARISGLCSIHQRMATMSIKRGRNMGMISYVSNQTAR